MLVAAGEKLNRLIGAWRTDAKLADKPFGYLVLFTLRNRPQPATLSLQGEDDIFTYRSGGNYTVGFAIFRAEADAQRRGFMRRTQGLHFAFDHSAAAVGGLNAKDHFRGFGSSRSQQSGKPDDFARPHFKIERVDHPFLAKIFKGRNRFFTEQRAPGTLQRVRVKLAAQHHLHQFDLRQIFCLAGAHKGPVTQHRDPVAHLINLIEEVGDEDQADALIAQLPHQGEKHFNLFSVEACGGLIKDQHFG